LTIAAKTTAIIIIITYKHTELPLLCEIKMLVGPSALPITPIDLTPFIRKLYTVRQAVNIAKITKKVTFFYS